jgi:hypothetical protein
MCRPRSGKWTADPAAVGDDVTVKAMTAQQVRRSFVNCSKGEASGLALPKGFDDLNWAEVVAERAAELHERVNSFVEAVRR